MNPVKGFDDLTPEEQEKLLSSIDMDHDEFNKFRSDVKKIRSYVPPISKIGKNPKWEQPLSLKRVDDVVDNSEENILTDK